MTKNFSKILIISLPATAILLITLWLFITIRDLEQRRQQSEFEQLSTAIANKFQLEINSYTDILIAIESFFYGSTYVSFEEFEKFTENFFSRYSGIRALSWNQKVTNDERDIFEKSIQEQGYSDFLIKDSITEGKVDPSPDRPIYFPVTYTVPFEKNYKAHGFDTYNHSPETNNIRRQTLNEARDTGETKATTRVPIIQDENNSYGLLLYHPIYHGGKSDNIEKRQQNLMGYASGVFIIPEMVSTLATEAQKYNIDFILNDSTNSENIRLLYDSRTADNKESKKKIKILENSVQYTIDFKLAGKHFGLHFIDNRGYSLSYQDWGIWSILVGGFLLSIVTAAFLNSSLNKTLEVEALVDIRTKELESANHKLQSEIKLREKAEESTAEKAEELSKRNKELQKFNKMAVGRENRMVELKKEINELSEELGKKPPYDIDFDI